MIFQNVPQGPVGAKTGILVEEEIGGLPVPVDPSLFLPMAVFVCSHSQRIRSSFAAGFDRRTVPALTRSSSLIQSELTVLEAYCELMRERCASFMRTQTSRALQGGAVGATSGVTSIGMIAVKNRTRR